MTLEIDWTKVHAKSNEALEGEFENIRNVVINNDPKYLIPELTLFYYISLNKGVIEPGYFEYLCGLIVSEGQQKEYKNQFSWNSMGSLIKSLESFFENWIYSNLARKVKDLNDGKEKDKQFLIASISTDYVLNGGEINYELLKNQVINLFNSSKDWLESNEGFNVIQAFQIVEAIIDLYEHRLSKFKNDIVTSSRNLMNLEYYLICKKDFNSEQEQEFKRLYEDEEAREDLLAHFVANEYENAEKDILLITVEELIEYKPEIDKTSLNNFIQRFSSYIDERQSKNFKYPTDNNPFREKPILNFDDKFIVPNILSLVWAMHNEIESDILMDEKYRGIYTDRKGKYLEEQVNEVFRGILPGCEIYSSLYYYVVEDGEEKRCELDHLIIYDSNIFLIESKSGRFTKPARRGAFLRFQSNIEDNIEKAFEQASRARRYIEENEISIFTDRNGKEIFTLKNKEDYFNLFLINTTLDNFGEAATKLHELSNIGVYRYKEYPWSVNLNDLMKIAEFIEFPSQFLHYVHRRLKVNNRIQIESVIDSSSELDLFYNYLVQNLYFDDITGNDLIILERGGEAFLNDYLSNTENKEKPRQVISEEIGTIINMLEQNRQFGYSHIIMKLLELNSNARNHVESTIHEVIETSYENIGKITEAVITTETHLDSDFGISIIACNSSSLNYENWLVRCYLRMYEHKTSNWLGLIKYTDKESEMKIDSVLMLARKEPLEDDRELGELLNQISKTI
ncbi:nuclease-related domain-containing protein [Bacillus toyonensis]|uniref:nuclease-related domain-containing protein n=1 Tax=Bacillus toyonensis TaxID=155322 RepID=UPI00259FB82B|nr:nuclease-related domain-containing protein [Bacillus toyonensis]MDM5257051.1 nuclease-related domain-containing protein [Bacillus toyonensis]